MGYKIKLTIYFLFVTLLTACGGSGLEEKIEESASPSIRNTSAQTYSDNTAISTLSFSNSGGGLLTGCTADSLPSGLSVRVSSDRNTCEITGTPTRSQSIAAYTITATNAFGSDTAITRITVTTEPPTFSAPTLSNASTQTYIVNTAISVLRFTNSSDGSLTACAADSLPAGLSLAISVDGDSCEISGTPTEAQAATSHMITATNASGSDTATVNITVDAEAVTLAVPELENSLPQTYRQNSPVVLRFISSGGGFLSSCTADSLPAGLSISVATSGFSCEIRGTLSSLQESTIHTITATNASGSDSATVDITVASGLFITRWDTDNLGATNDNQIKIGTRGDGYNYTVVWGDGSVDENVDGDITHTYASSGRYTVSISGKFPQIYFGPSILGESDYDAEKLISIEQWGDIKWQSMHSALRGCINVINNAEDAPDISRVRDMSYMFFLADKFSQDLTGWDVSLVTDMSHMFLGLGRFNQDISEWDVSSVTSMQLMFSGADSFNQDISGWDVSLVENMYGMFSGATVFNQDLSRWNVSSVKFMNSMFFIASNFNQDISSWDVSSVENMSTMFSLAGVFNQDISKWNVSSVRVMSSMFYDASSFNQSLNDWDVSSVEEMAQMFRGATSFNEELSNWDVSSVVNMDQMFTGAVAFDQNISSWDVTSVESMYIMFRDMELSTANYDALLLGWSARSLQSDVSFHGGGSTYSSSSQSARDVLTEAFNWTVTDGGVAQ